MRVQVAADVAELEQVGRRLARVELAQLGRPERRPSAAYSSSSSAASGSCPSDATYSSEPGRPDELGAEALRRRAATTSIG